MVILSGPSLRKHDAHSLIHEAALNEAKELRKLLENSIRQGEYEKAVKVAEVSIEHWESRTLQHATSEEEGLYKDMVEENPHLEPLVTQLTRDHDLMRKMVEQMKYLLMKDNIDGKLVSLLDSLIIVDSFHNEDEVKHLLVKNENDKWDLTEGDESA